MRITVLRAAVGLLAMATEVRSHGIVSRPKALYVKESESANFVKTLNGNTFEKINWSMDPDTNVANFLKYWKTEKKIPFETLKALIDSEVKDCGNSKLGPPVNVAGMTDIEWKNDHDPEYKKVGFVPSHTGPCEVWIDTTKAFADDNCARKFGIKYPANIPVDYSVCKAECTLTFYWIALHQADWQLYKTCVRISNGPASNTTLPVTTTTGTTTTTGVTTTGVTTPVAATVPPTVVGPTPAGPNVCMISARRVRRRKRK